MKKYLICFAVVSSRLGIKIYSKHTFSMINFILLVHKDPDQVRRLVDRLSSDESYFYIHVDKDVDISLFKKELEGLENVYFLENEQREYGTWVDIGIVEATINALKQILKDKREGYCVLLSGQDYPIKSIGHIA